VPHKVAAFRRRETGQRRRYEVAHLVKGARPRRPQERFQFGKGLFDGIEVGTVGREKTQLRADGFNGLAYRRLLVQRQIVEHDDIATPERRHEDLLDVGQKGGIVEWAVKDGRRGQAGRRQRGDDGVQLPLAARREVAQAIPAGAAAIPAQQIGRDPALVEKDIVPRIADGLAELPAAARGRDISPPLLVGVYRFL